VLTSPMAKVTLLRAEGHRAPETISMEERRIASGLRAAKVLDEWAVLPV